MNDGCRRQHQQDERTTVSSNKVAMAIEKWAMIKGLVSIPDGLNNAINAAAYETAHLETQNISSYDTIILLYRLAGGGGDTIAISIY